MDSAIIRTFDFVFFRGFRPKPLDRLSPITQRMPLGKRVAYLSVGASGIRTASVTLTAKGVKIDSEECAPLARFGEPTKTDIFAGIPKKTNCSMVIVQFGDVERLEIAQGVRLLTPQAELVKLSHSTRAFLGSEATNDFRYGLLTHPISPYGYLAFLERNRVESVLAWLREKQLHVLRAQSSIISLLSLGMAIPDVAAGKSNLLIADHGHLVFVRTDANSTQWAQPRLKPNVLLHESANRTEAVESMLAESGEKDLVVLDTQLNVAIREHELPMAKLNPLSLSPVQLAVTSALADTAEKGTHQPFTTVLRGLAHDVDTVNAQPSFVFPRWMRAAGLAFWAGLAVGVGAMVLAKSQRSTLAEQMRALDSSKAPILSQIAAREAALAELDGRTQTASKLDYWITNNPAIQPMLINLVQPLDRRVRVSQFSLTREEESGSSSTHRVLINFTAETRQVNAIVGELTTSTQPTGWTLTPINQGINAGTISFEALLTQPRHAAAKPAVGPTLQPKASR